MDTLPGQEMDPWRAFAWFVGEVGDARYAGALGLYRKHEKAHDVLMNAWYQDPFEAATGAECSENAWRSNKRVHHAVEDLRKVRAIMRARRLLPPDLSPQFSFVDDEVYTNNPQEETT